MTDLPLLSRRSVVRGGALGMAALTAGGLLLPGRAAAQDAITKPIPSSGERLPVIGLGTNSYSVEGTEQLAELQQVLEALLQEGGSVVDTARAYGRSEEVIGDLIGRIGQRDRFFISTKTPMGPAPADPAVELETAARRLKVQTIDLVLVHNLAGTDKYLPALLAAKEAGRIRYIGISTSSERQYAELAEAMRRYPLDFIQVNYSLANRAAEETLLPLAQERRMAVMINVPFGGRNPNQNVFGKLTGPLPDFAAAFDATSWAQVALKYVVSHPAVTVAIPGTTRVRHLLDNQGAGKGRLPDAAARKALEAYWDSLA